MTIESYTGTIATNGEFVNVETATGIDFTASKTYSMQIQNKADLKIANAIFPFENEKFKYTAGTNDLYIRTENNYTCTITILENEENE